MSRSTSTLSRHLVCAALALTACGDGAPSGPPDLLDIERLAWIGAGETALWTDVACGSQVALLVDRHEVTRAQWLARFGAAPALRAEPWGPGGDDLPATGMTQQEAQAFAEGRGMRLPTASEWLWVAGGPRGASYPYALIQRESAVNSSDVGLGRTTPVGTFASGRTPTGVDDLAGNVWEWAAAPMPDPAFPYEADLGLPAWILGGSYLSPARPLHEGRGVWAREVEPGHRGLDIGFRCVAPAEAWLREHAPRFTDPALEARLVALGARWGRQAGPLLQRLGSAPDAPVSIAWLLEGAYR